MRYDLVLSCGFLAFAEQAGFLRAVEEVGLDVDGICGTSSGAIAGALWAAGMPAEDVLHEMTRATPLRRIRPSFRPWRGLFSMRPVVSELRRNLPNDFSTLGRPFGVGVIDRARRPTLITEGSLPHAVAASAAIPRLFTPVRHGRGRFADGGVVDRTALTAWRAYRDRPVVLHLVERTNGADSTDDLTGIPVVRSAASGAKLWSLGDVHGRYERSRANAHAALSELVG